MSGYGQYTADWKGRRGGVLRWPKRSVQRWRQGRTEELWGVFSRVPKAGPGGPLCTGGSPGCGLRASQVVIQEELVRDRAQIHGRQFALALVADPGLDKIGREHTAFEQESVIFLKRVENLAQ